MGRRNQKITKDPLGVQNLNESKIIKTAAILIENGKFTSKLARASRKIRSELNKLEQGIEPTNRVQEIRNVLINISNIPKKEGPVSDFAKTAIQNALAKQNDQTPTGNPLEALKQNHPVEATKRVYILRERLGRENTHEIEVLDTSTKQRLIDRFNISWARQIVEALKDQLERGEYKHYLLKSNVEEFYYGADEGQRACVQAKLYFQSLEQNILDIETETLAQGLLDAVTQEMDSKEKASWRNVSNYWLSGSETSQNLGLTGERQEGLSNQSRWLKKSEDAFNHSKRGSLETVNFTELHPDEKQIFIDNFRASQWALDKNWQNDIIRENYLHKPGNNTNSIRTYEDLICRRMCKWILHVAHFNQQPLIYAVDKLELGPIARGDTLKIVDNINHTGIKQKVPVCTSELREIFRHIDKFEGAIHFYKGLEPVPAPWQLSEEHGGESLLKDWAEYAMHLTRRLLIEHPGDERCQLAAESMLNHWDQENWEAVIEAYKNMQPSQLRPYVLPTPVYGKRLHEDRVSHAKIRFESNTEVSSNTEALIDTLTDRIVTPYNAESEGEGIEANLENKAENSFRFFNQGSFQDYNESEKENITPNI